jgi:hypothetical protein
MARKSPPDQNVDCVPVNGCIILAQLLLNVVVLEGIFTCADVVTGPIPSVRSSLPYP